MNPLKTFHSGLNCYTRKQNSIKCNPVSSTRTTSMSCVLSNSLLFSTLRARRKSKFQSKLLVQISNPTKRYLRKYGTKIESVTRLRQSHLNTEWAEVGKTFTTLEVNAGRIRRALQMDLVYA